MPAPRPPYCFGQLIQVHPPAASLRNHATRRRKSPCSPSARTSLFECSSLGALFSSQVRNSARNASSSGEKLKSIMLPGVLLEVPRRVDRIPANASLSSHIRDGIVKVRAIDIAGMIVESRNQPAHAYANAKVSMIDLKLDIPADIFDAEFSLAAFSDRMREVAILELVRSKRMHEHEALDLLGLERRELLEKMKACGIVPTENAFAEIKGELEKAIKTRAKT